MLFALAYYALLGVPMMYLRPVLRNYPASIARTLTLLIAFVGGSLGFAVPSLLLHWWWRVPLVPLRQLVTIIVVDGFVAVALSLVIGAFVKLRRDVQAAERIIHEQELRERKLSEAAAQAQAQALQAQINPHFFFNTLNTISAVIAEDPDAARELVGQLGELFRYTLRCARAQVVTLGEELAFVQTYLQLEKARLRERLMMDWQVEASLPALNLPGLTLQPIVENAIRHGIARCLSGGCLSLEVQHDTTHCTITIRHPYEPSEGRPDLSPLRLFQPGHALFIVRERLQLTFGEQYSLLFKMLDDEQIEVRLTLPLNRPEVMP